MCRFPANETVWHSQPKTTGSHPLEYTHLYSVCCLRTVYNLISFTCFFLSPVPTITWRKMSGNIPKKARLRKSQAVLEIPNIQLEDSGSYECKAENTRGGTAYRGHLQVYSEYKSDLEQHSNYLEKNTCISNGIHIKMVQNHISHVFAHMKLMLIL